MSDKNKIADNQYSASVFGIFIAGFSHSGASAVVDWLRGNSSIILPEGKGVVSLNYGLSNLLKVVDCSSNHLEWVARKMLCPDNSLWPEVFGERLGVRDFRYWAGGFIKELLYIVLANIRAKDVIKGVPDRLNLTLRQDYKSDTEYLNIIRQIIVALRNAQEHGNLYDSQVMKEVSFLFALFYSRWSERKRKILIFDNAFTGRRAKYFELIDNTFFTDQIIIFVYRDPRDQFVRKITGSSFSGSGSRSFNRFMINRFITEYRMFLDEVHSLIRNSKTKPYKDVMLISFEDFVYNKSGIRDNLFEIFSVKLKNNGIDSEWSNNYFSPEISKKNIGVWKNVGLDKEIKKITMMLPEFLHSAAN